MTKPARTMTKTLGDSQLRSIVGGAPTGGYNQAETLASSLLKKRDDTTADTASKV